MVDRVLVVDILVQLDGADDFLDENGVGDVDVLVPAHCIHLDQTGRVHLRDSPVGNGYHSAVPVLDAGETLFLYWGHLALRMFQMLVQALRELLDLFLGFLLLAGVAEGFVLVKQGVPVVPSAIGSRWQHNEHGDNE